MLRLHKQRLPYELKALGDEYARDEFKRHKTASGSQVCFYLMLHVFYVVTSVFQLKMFFSEWDNYVATVSSQHPGQPHAAAIISIVNMFMSTQRSVLGETWTRKRSRP